MAEENHQRTWRPDRGKSDEQSIETGKVLTEGSNSPIKGQLNEDGRMLFVGDSSGDGRFDATEGEDKIYGTSRDDVAIIGTPKTDSDNPTTFSETFEGGEGYDTAVVSGTREDYIIRLPDADEYPASDRIEGDLYGSTIILEHAETGNLIRLENVESIVFDNNASNPEIEDGLTDSISKRDHALNEIDAGVASSEFTEISFIDAFNEAEYDVIASQGEDALRQSKIYGTPEFREAITEAGGSLSLNEDELKHAIDNAIEAVGEREIETNYPDGQPTTDATADRIGVQQPDSPLPLPDFGRWR